MQKEVTHMPKSLFPWYLPHVAVRICVVNAGLDLCCKAIQVHCISTSHVDYEKKSPWKTKTVIAHTWLMLESVLITIVIMSIMSLVSLIAANVQAVAQGNSRWLQDCMQ